MLSRALAARVDELKKRMGGVRQQDALLGLRVEFGTDQGRFVQTLEAMLDLGSAGCPVPQVIDADFAKQAIIARPIEGTRFDELRRKGALTERSRHLIEEALLAIHRAGYVVGEINEGDLLITAAGTPFISSLRHAVPLAGLSRDMSVHLRDCDRHRFNALFGTSLLTAEELRRLLSPAARVTRDKPRGFAEVYAPVIIRDDIRWGKIWNTDLGVGRWNFIMKEHLPIPRGGSVLDLGSNNGFNPLQMLRSGASSAVGVEIELEAIKQGKFLKSAYEWLDNRSYDFRYIHGSQADLPKFDLPTFDIVTALCCLYYLPEHQIRDLVRYIRTLTSLLVIQCNTDRLIDRSGQDETYWKASVPFALEMVEQAGFTKREIIAPAGYSRPLVIARA
jgi:SAM-dependent methyltransferase